MTTVLGTFGRQIWAYSGGVLVAATVTALLDNVLAPWIHARPRVDFGRFSIAQLPGAVASLAVVSFLAFVVPFVLFRLLVIINEGCERPGRPLYQAQSRRRSLFWR